jgi:single-strand DNA-binding protein
MSDNTLTITGNLAEDPTIRFTQSGIAVASLTVMQTKREKQGQDYVDGAKNGLRVTAWRDLAENIAESLGKGDRVTVTGRLEPQQWQDKETGANRYGWELVAEDVAVSLRFHTAKPQKVDRRQQGGGYGAQQGQGAPYSGQGYGGQAQGGYGPQGGQQGGYGAPQGGGQDDYSDPPF